MQVFATRLPSPEKMAHEDQNLFISVIYTAFKQISSLLCPLTLIFPVLVSVLRGLAVSVSLFVTYCHSLLLPAIRSIFHE